MIGIQAKTFARALAKTKRQASMPVQPDMLDKRRRARNKPKPASEGEEQEALFTWARIAMSKYPELALMHHIPNGGSRTPWEARAFKRRGVVAGVPDVCLPVARGGYHGLYIELKRIGGKTSGEQNEFMDLLNEQRYCVMVCEGWEVAKCVIEDYLREDQIAPSDRT